jgi:hypothetical protein
VNSFVKSLVITIAIQSPNSFLIELPRIEAPVELPVEPATKFTNDFIAVDHKILQLVISVWNISQLNTRPSTCICPFQHGS